MYTITCTRTIECNPCRAIGAFFIIILFIIDGSLNQKQENGHHLGYQMNGKNQYAFVIDLHASRRIKTQSQIYYCFIEGI